MDITAARRLAQTIVLDDYADTWKQPKVFLHDAIADLIIEAVGQAEEATRLMSQAGEQLLAQRDDARAGLRAFEQQQSRAEVVATAAAIVLHELERDGQVQQHTRDLLASAVAAYEAGKQ